MPDASSENEKRLKSIFKAAPVGIGVVVNRVFREVNETLCRLTGYSGEELIGQSARLLYPGDEEYEFVGKEKYEQIRRTGMGVVETRFRRKDGSIIDVILSSAPFDVNDLSKGVTFTVLDITAQKRLQNERDRLFMLSLDLFAIAGFDGYFKQLNPAWSRVLGWSPEELLSRPWIEVVHPDDRSATNARLEALVRGEALTAFESRFRRRDGTYRWLSWDAFSVPAERLVYSVARDITERKRQEARLAEELEFRKAIIEHTAEGIAVCQPMAEAPHIRFGVWNEKMQQITGYTIEEMNASDWYETIFKKSELRRRARDRLQKFIAGENANNEEWVITRKDGAQRVLSVSTASLKGAGYESHALIVMRDVTDILKATEEIRREKELITRIADMSPVGIAHIDQEGRIQFVNSRIEELLGSPKETVLGRDYRTTFSQLEYEHGRRVDAGEMIRLQELRAPLYDVERSFRLFNGRRLTVFINFSPLFDSRGEFDGTVVTFQDVTERRRIEEELRKTDKLESIGVLAGGIAHDFRNLLEGIFGSIELARQEKDSPARVAERLDQALAVFERAKDLTEQLLTFSTGGLPIRRVMRTAPAVTEAAQFALSGSAVELRVRQAEDLWDLYADRNQIGQVVNNIVLNARQAIDADGVVEIILQNRVIGEQDALPLEAGPYVEIVISDNGRGIEKEHLEKVYDPFFTTKPRGSGLGLAICYSVVKKHGGHIHVDSEMGRGTTFHLYLPAAKRQAGQKVAAEAPPAHGTGRILVMDDEDFIRRVTADMLRHLGYEADGAVDGEEALAKYRAAMEEGRPYRLVILDLTVPGGLGGKDIIGPLKELDPAVLAVVASGYSDEFAVSHPEQFGFCAGLAKPFRFKELAAVLEAVLA